MSGIEITRPRYELTALGVSVTPFEGTENDIPTFSLDWKPSVEWPKIPDSDSLRWGIGLTVPISPTPISEANTSEMLDFDSWSITHSNRFRIAGPQARGSLDIPFARLFQKSTKAPQGIHLEASAGMSFYGDLMIASELSLGEDPVASWGWEPGQAALTAAATVGYYVGPLELNGGVVGDTQIGFASTVSTVLHWGKLQDLVNH